jgi:hypothetical protein
MALTQTPKQDLSLKVHLSGYVFEQWPEQKVQILANKIVIGSMSFMDKTKKIAEFLIPREVITQEGLIDLSFRYLNPVRQNKIGVSDDSRLQSIAMTNLVLDHKSLEKNPLKNSDAP